MTPGFDWRFGGEELQRAIEAALATSGTEEGRFEVLSHRPGRRRLLRLQLAGGEDLVLMHFAGGGRRQRLRKRVKNAVGRSTADRERRALEGLRAAGIAVPALRALAVLSDGGSVVATQYLVGTPLRDSLGGGRAERSALLDAVGALVRALHTGGRVHGNLHAGNIRVTRDGPVLLDLGAVRRSLSERGRRRDLGALDHSLAGRLTTTDRVRLRAAAMGLQRPFDASARHALRAVGRAGEARAQRHAASQTRGTLAPGRRFASLQFEGATGLRRRELADSDLLAALTAHRCAQLAGRQLSGGRSVLKSDGRSRVTAGPLLDGSWVIKEYSAAGWRRALVDLLRGSPARRAWLGGHGLLARGIGAARPAAFLETRRWGLPVASAIVLEDLRRDAPADADANGVATTAERVDALARLATQLHRRRIDHGDLKASHVYLRRCGRRIEARLIDLEGVKFRRYLRDGTRLRALAQLNASLPDDVEAGLRCAAFRRYAVALPFVRGRDRALRRIVRASLRRGHRWSGKGCNIAGESSGACIPNVRLDDGIGGAQIDRD